MAPRGLSVQINLPVAQRPRWHPAVPLTPALFLFPAIAVLSGLVFFLRLCTPHDNVAAVRTLLAFHQAGARRCVRQEWGPAMLAALAWVAFACALVAAVAARDWRAARRDRHRRGGGGGGGGGRKASPRNSTYVHRRSPRGRHGCARLERAALARLARAGLAPAAAACCATVAVFALLELGAVAPRRRARRAAQTALRSYAPVFDRLADPCRSGRERCVISFGVYGADEYYLQGALRNIELARKFYPGWSVRFYTDDQGSLPPSYVEQLSTEISEVVPVSLVEGAIAGMFWRLLVANDPDVDRFIVRDIDSSLGGRERAAVEEWIASRRKFHVFRDAPVHNVPIVGCCWGAVGGALPYIAVEGLIRSGRVDHLMKAKGGDQDFLALYVWPLIADEDLIAHDSYLCDSYPSTKAWPTARRGGWDMAARIDGARPFGRFWAPAALADDPMNVWDEAHGDEAALFDVRALGGLGAASTSAMGARAGHGPCPETCRPPKHRREWLFC